MVNTITGHEGPEVKQRHSSPLSLTPALDGVGGQRPPPPRRPLYPLASPGTHCIGGWVGPRARTGIRSPDRPALSEPPHRLSYPGPQLLTL